jgi:hypothetical protein
MADRKYVLSYLREPFWNWDHFVLTACQAANYGNFGNWFYSFRGGLNGFHARMAGAEHHYALMHAWLPQPRSPKETEYHLAAFFFHIDSAIECLVFALNALGYAVKKSSFRDIGDASSLRRIGPPDLLGDPKRGVKQLKGYTELYPNTVALWASSRPLLELVFEQHNVSKHRHMIYEGGSMRTDAPPDFWENLDIKEEDRRHFFPVRDVILGNDLRKPLEKRKAQKVEEFIYLEDIADEFFSLISEVGRLILDDSTSNIPIQKKLK